MLDIIALKFNLREKDSPYFTDQELETLLMKNDNDINKASYEGLVMKSEDDSIALPGGLDVPSNRAYWLGLAKRFKESKTRILSRADEC